MSYSGKRKSTVNWQGFAESAGYHTEYRHIAEAIRRLENGDVSMTRYGIRVQARCDLGDVDDTLVGVLRIGLDWTRTPRNGSVVQTCRGRAHAAISLLRRFIRTGSTSVRPWLVNNDFRNTASPCRTQSGRSQTFCSSRIWCRFSEHRVRPSSDGDGPAASRSRSYRPLTNVPVGVGRQLSDTWRPPTGGYVRVVPVPEHGCIDEGRIRNRTRHLPHGQRLIPSRCPCGHQGTRH